MSIFPFEIKDKMNHKKIPRKAGIDFLKRKKEIKKKGIKY